MAMPSEQQKVLLSQLLSLREGDKHAFITRGLPAIPGDLQALVAPQVVCDEAGSKAKALLLALSEEVPAPQLSQSSSLSQARGYYKVENWASGGAPFRRFKVAALTAYVDELFELVAALLASISGEPPHKILRRQDLFHGHWVYCADAKDVLIVFHAKEYPADIEETKANHARELEGDKYERFVSADRSFKLRCPIWSMARHTVFIPDFSALDNPYRVLLDNPDLTKRDNPLLLSQTNLGACIADVNCFSNEGVAGFFRVW
jgi:hypothetical protein